MALDADTIYGFSEAALKKNFDGIAPTPKFHKEMWELCCSPAQRVAIAAPRSHAKTTAISHTYTLANVLFRERQYVLIVSDTEGQAVQFLADIKNELRENEKIRDLFKVSKFVKDVESDVIVRCTDGYEFRIQAKGSEQKVRGLKWRNKRPDLIVGDDLENDEIVMNQDRRAKFRNWFYGALLPCLSDRGIIRIVGTVLHLDSLLERLMGDDTWKHKRYQAHNADFTEILWPERFTRERLETIRQGYANQGFPEGYAQEYLNFPIDESTAYFKKGDFLKLTETEEPLEYYAACDLAISERARADFTVIVVAGIDSKGILKIVDVRRGRWDSIAIIDEIFNVHERYNPVMMTLEGGMISKSILPILNSEMPKRGKFPFLNIETPTTDKRARARGIQGRMRAGGVQFDTEAEWFPALQQEMLRFPRDRHDDQVDAMAWIGLTLDKVHEARTPEEVWEDEYEDEFIEDLWGMGRNATTGY